MDQADRALIAAAEAWIADDPDPLSRRELQMLLVRREFGELRERFSGPLTFGTAGLRGLLGAGPSRMNAATVSRATAGLARWILADIEGAAEKGVVIGRDGRNQSPELAWVTAEVLTGHGVKVFFFDDPVPTPLVAFACRHMGAAAGVVVTASHNPPGYNGYKVYSARGAQIVPSEADAIRAAGEGAPLTRSLPRMHFNQAVSQGRVQMLGPELGEVWLAALEGQCVGPKQPSATLKIVTTSLHGVGHPWLTRALQRRGHGPDVVFPVKAQQEPDGAFPTVDFPNPEEPGALDLALALALSKGADLIVANDPDADRLALAVREPGAAAPSPKPATRPAPKPAPTPGKAEAKPATAEAKAEAKPAKAEAKPAKAEVKPAKVEGETRDKGEPETKPEEKKDEVAPAAPRKAAGLVEAVGLKAAEVAPKPAAPKPAPAGPSATYRVLSGNEVGVLLGDWLLGQKAKAKALPDKPLVVTTVVSTTMLEQVAAAYGARCEETLTGFKWIWDKALALEAGSEPHTFVFGFEEALGYSVGPAVRDKDGIGAALVAVELAAALKAEGKTLLDRLDELSVQHGLHVTSQVSTVLEGSEGKAKIEAVMEGLRAAPPKAIAGAKVERFEDLAKPKKKGAPSGNVLIWRLADKCRVILRPSGTEPKLKAYLEARVEVKDKAKLDAARGAAEKRLEALEAWVSEAVGGGSGDEDAEQ